MKSLIAKSALTAALLAAQSSACAADIDLYNNLPAASAANTPNVLFVIDNTANWSSAFNVEMLALKNTFASLPSDKFNVGIMFSDETGRGNSGDSGGYIRAAMRLMTTANKAKYASLIESFDKTADKSNGGASGMQMVDVYRYFSGGAPVAGNNKVKTDYRGNTEGTAADRAVWALTGNALTSKAGTTYNSPLVSGSCAKNYVIYISNGPNQQSNSLNATANAYLAAAGGSTAEIPLSPVGSQDNPMDEWARFMRTSSLAVTFFTIDIDRVTTGQGPGWTALLKSTSTPANYTAVSSGDTDAISKAINNALSKIQSINSVFAAVSLPASANVQGAYLNQLYVGMFRPDGNSKPRWMGNLKQYTTHPVDSYLIDQNGDRAINAGKGFITECARAFWTPSTVDTYWSADPKGDCLVIPNATSNTPDGNVVEKGAQAYVMRQATPASRIVKTCSETFTSCTSLLDFSASTVSLTSTGAASTTELESLVLWAKGANLDGELSKTDTAAMRPSAHGDVVHSNPMALTYVTGSTTDVIVYYGSNDGMLHAVNGNQTRAYGTVPAGGELWAFMPPEFFPHLKRLRTNTEVVKITAPFSSTTPSPGLDKPYGIDGAISAYRSGVGESDVTWLYGTMRRGGRAIYAFDVTNPTAPSLKWKMGCGDATTATDAKCSAGATGIGQTWSGVRPVKAQGYAVGTTPQPMVVFGGGYDTCEDADTNTCTSSSKGRRVYVLDANTGAILNTDATKLVTDRPVVAEIKFVPDALGFAKYGYVVDLGGNIYRINIGTAAPADWTITKIAALGCNPGTAGAFVATCANNRKFMFPPSIVSETDGSYSLYLGSGDREKPLGSLYFPQTVGVANYFFKVKDKPTDLLWLSAEAVTNCPGRSIICMNSLRSAGNVGATCGAAGGIPDGKGWMLGMRATEQVVTPSATRFGVATFSTHMPATSVDSSCNSNLGTVHVYNIDIATATPSAGTTCDDVVSGGGLPPPPEKPDICTNASCSRTKSICIGCSTGSALEGDPNDMPSALLGSNSKRRVYWYIQQ